MDLHAAMQQFYNDKGEITLAPQLSLAGLAELLYQGDLHTGGGDRKVMRYWDYSNSRDGELVGINFDRTWLSTMSDLEFDPAMCRNISVDIRYVLFVIEKIGGAGYLIDEMTLR